MSGFIIIMFVVSGVGAIHYVNPPLILYGTPGNESTISEAGIVIFNCSLDADPLPSFTIRTEDNQTLHAGLEQTVSLKLYRYHNRVGLYCRADGSLKQYPLDSEHLVYTIQFSASNITMSRSPTGQVSENTEVTFTCVTDEAEPTAEVVWTVGESNKSSTIDSTANGLYNTERRISVLSLKVHRTLNNKEVRCHVGGKAVVQDTETLNVTFAATSLTLSPSITGPASEAILVTLNCTSSESNPTAEIVWSRDGVTVIPGDVTTEPGLYNGQTTVSILRVTADRELNGAVYRCQVEGTDLSRKYIMDVICYSGRSFTCVTDESNPTAKIVWTRNGYPVSTGISDSEETGRYTAHTTRSILTVTTDRSLNGAVYMCQVQGQPPLSDSDVLEVKFPHDVKVTQNPLSPVSEGTRFTFTCEATGGNPQRVLSYSWSFVPRYEVSRDSSSGRQIEIQNVEYTHAGNYTCVVVNGGGAGTGHTELLVQFPPMDISSSIQRTTYAALNSNALLDCTVRAYPGLDPSSITVKFMNDFLPTQNILIRPLTAMPDAFLIEIMFNPVTDGDFGLYKVTINNGIGLPTEINMILVERSPPETPRFLEVLSVTAISITVTWLPGRSGGANQTFTVSYGKPNDAENSIDIADPGAGIRVNSTVTDLEPETMYSFTVQATNKYGAMTHRPVYATTLDLPIVTGNMDATVSDSDITFRWESLQGTLTSIEIHKCPSSGGCEVIYVFSDPSVSSVVVNGEHSSEAQYKLVFYQGDVPVNEQYFQVSTVPKEPKKSSVGGIVGGLLSVLIAIGAAVFGAWYYRRRRMQKKTEDNKPTDSSFQQPIHGTPSQVKKQSYYENVEIIGDKSLNQDNHYISIERQKTSKASHYEDLDTKGKPSGVGLYTELKPTPNNKRLLADKDTHFGTQAKTLPKPTGLEEGILLYEGPYSILKNGTLKLEGRMIDVVVKSPKANLTNPQDQYLFKQVSCLQHIGQHPVIVETFPFAFRDATDVKLVMKSYSNGNLRHFLQTKADSQGKWINFNGKKTFYRNMCLNILQGLAFLESQEHKVLHYQVCTEHVLVDDCECCRLTGFGFSEDVMERELQEEADGIYGDIQWKAPEVIEDCKAHTRSSDVWAFGILMYEIYTDGGSPYDGYTEDDIRNYVKEGNILEKLPNCPTNMYEIMKTCWEYNPDKRPTFVKLLKQIETPHQPKPEKLQTPKPEKLQKPKPEKLQKPKPEKPQKPKPEKLQKPKPEKPQKPKPEKPQKPKPEKLQQPKPDIAAKPAGKGTSPYVNVSR